MDTQFVTKTPTKLVGTTFSGRQELLVRLKEEALTTLELIREPTNDWDPDAIQAIATFRDGTREVVGHIQNSDRMCMGVLPDGKECGAIIDGSIVSRSRTVLCPRCGAKFAADKTNTVNIQEGQDNIKYTTCSCGTRFQFNRNNVYVHSCGCHLNLRVGLASKLCRGMEAGIVYKVRILEITGGDMVEGKRHSHGCNILVEKDEANSAI